MFQLDASIFCFGTPIREGRGKYSIIQNIKIVKLNKITIVLIRISMTRFSKVTQMQLTPTQDPCVWFQRIEVVVRVL